MHTNCFEEIIMFRTALFAAIILTLPFGNLSAQDSDNIEQIGRIYNQWDFVTDVAYANDLVYVCTWVSGLQIVDVSDPQEPNVIGYWDEGYAFYVTVEGNYAYVLDGDGLRIIDISDPEDIECVGFYENAPMGDGGTPQVVIHGEYAYISDMDGDLRIVDIGNPESPEEIAVFDMEPGITITTISGDYLYVRYLAQWEDNRRSYNFGVINISDPVNPVEIGSCETPSDFGDVEISGDYAFAAAGREGLYVIDISDSENPEMVGECDTPEHAVRIALQGDYAFVADRTGGLRIIDISNPENPEEIGSYETERGGCPYMVNNVVVNGESAYITDMHNGLFVLGISDLEQPEEIGRRVSGKPIHHVAVTDDHAYVASIDSIRIVDVSDPELPEEVATYNPGMSFIKSIVTVDNFAYVLGRSGVRPRLQILNITDREQPDELGSIDMVMYDTDFMEIRNSYAYVVTGDTLKIINVSDPSEPEEAGFFMDDNRHDRNTGIAKIAVRDDLGFVTFERSGWQILDVGNPAEIEEIYYSDAPEFVHNIYISGDFAYIVGREMNRERGLWIYDVSSPQEPEEIGYCYLTGIGNHIIVEDYCAFIGNSHGISVLDVRNPEEMSVVGHYDTPGWLQHMTISNCLIYVADNTNMGIYRFTDPAKVDDPIVSFPTLFNLSATYPNPFNSQTHIRYQLPTETHLDLGLYDISGRRVMTLFEGMRPAGVWSATLDGSNLTSGLYFIRLNSTEQRISQKVMLVR